MKFQRCIVTLCAICVCNIVIADNQSFDFKALSSSANSDNWRLDAPWKLPEGYTQTIVADEKALNIFNNGRNDFHDMNTVNESGPKKGRYMYRTHELRAPKNQPEGGALSVVDLTTGKTRLLAQQSDWNAIDGIQWTPWGTLLFAEEVTRGRLFELMLNSDLMSANKVIDRPAVGRLAHEGIEIDQKGNVYLVDEFRGLSEKRKSRGNTCGGKLPCGGGIYKFVPNKFGDLSSGDLYVLGIKAKTNRDGTGQGEWLGPINANKARSSGTHHGGKSYQRPEDLEIIGNVLYAAITEGPRDEYDKERYEGRVLSIDLDSLMVSNFAKAGVNVPVEINRPGESGFQTGFDSVDNLAEAPNGDLVMIEDNSPSDIWFASTKTNEFGASRQIKLFASLTDPKAEGTGIYFSPHDPSTLYVNIQHAKTDDGDGTWAIRKK